MKTSELINKALDHAVAVALGAWSESGYWDTDYSGYKPEPVSYSTDWMHGGPIIEQARICIDQPDDLKVLKDCQAFTRVCITGAARRPHFVQHGPTPLIAAMRCYVASKLGDEVEVPNELK